MSPDPDDVLLDAMQALCICSRSLPQGVHVLSMLALNCDTISLPEHILIPSERVSWHLLEHMESGLPAKQLNDAFAINMLHCSIVLHVLLFNKRKGLGTC